MVYLLYLSLLPKAINTEATEIADPGAFASAQRRTQANRKARGVDYRQFSHISQPHRLECKTCHQFPSKNWKEIRQGDEGFPDVSEYPEHQSCISCHRSQFFARQRPVPYICSNCHVKATPRDTSRYPFRVSARSSWLLIKRRALFRLPGLFSARQTSRCDFKTTRRLAKRVSSAQRSNAAISFEKTYNQTMRATSRVIPRVVRLATRLTSLRLNQMTSL